MQSGRAISMQSGRAISMQSGSAIGETLEELHGGWQERPHTSVAISRNQRPSRSCTADGKKGLIHQSQSAAISARRTCARYAIRKGHQPQSAAISARRTCARYAYSAAAACASPILRLMFAADSRASRWPLSAYLKRDAISAHQCPSKLLSAHQRQSELLELIRDHQTAELSGGPGRRAERVHSEEELASFLETSAHVRAVGALECGLVMLILFFRALRTIAISGNQWQSVAIRAHSLL